MTKQYFVKYVFVPKTDSYETSDMLYDRKTVYLIIFSFPKGVKLQNMTNK